MTQVTMDPAQKAFTTNLLNAQLTKRVIRRDMLVEKFGDRITKAIQSEVDNLTREIESLERLKMMVEEAPEE